VVLVCRVLGSDAGQGVVAAVAEPVAGALQREDVGVVDDAVDHRGGDGLVAEDAAPALWAWLKFVGGGLGLSPGQTGSAACRLMWRRDACLLGDT